MTVLKKTLFFSYDAKQSQRSLKQRSLSEIIDALNVTAFMPLFRYEQKVLLFYKGSLPIVNIKDQNNQMDNIQYLPIGVIEALWINQRGSVDTIKYGTAFALTKNIIMTCTHNIYQETSSTFCSSILFYLNFNPQAQLSALQHYPSRLGQFHQTFQVSQTLKIKPSKEQLCLIALSKDLPMSQFISLGTLQQKNSTIEKVLTISGYPSNHFPHEFDYWKTKTRRVNLSGELLSCEGDIINYRLKTKKGHSGSPILYKNQAGSYMAIGIHTHKGLSPDYDSGLFFTMETLGRVQQFSQLLRGRYSLPGKIIYMLDQQKLKNPSKILQNNYYDKSRQSNEFKCQLKSGFDSSCSYVNLSSSQSSFRYEDTKNNQSNMTYVLAPIQQTNRLDKTKYPLLIITNTLSAGEQKNEQILEIIHKQDNEILRSAKSLQPSIEYNQDNSSSIQFLKNLSFLRQNIDTIQLKVSQSFRYLCLIYRFLIPRTKGIQ